MTREQYYAEAEKCTCHDRDVQYGPPENSFDAIGKMWTVDLNVRGLLAPGAVIDAKTVGYLMTEFKIVREAHAHKDDNIVDAIGYLGCAGEIASNEDFIIFKGETKNERK